MSSMKNVLITIYHKQRFLDLFDLAKQLSFTKDVNILIYINKEVYSKYKSNLTNNKNITIINDPEILIESQKKFTKKTNDKAKLATRLLFNFKTLLLKTSLAQILKQIRYRRYLDKKYTYFLEILSANNIDIIFTTGDRHVHEEPAIIKAARDFQVKIVLPYITNYAEPKTIFRVRERSMTESGSLYSYYMRKKFIRYLYNGASYYPFYIINTIHKFGVLSKNPWIMGNGVSDIICLDSQRNYDRFINHKVHEKKLKIVGHYSYDNLYKSYCKRDELIKKIHKKYNLDKDKKNIIISLPQFSEHELMSNEKHINEVIFMITSLCQTSQNILISLHPKQNIDKYIFLEKKFKCKILSERLMYVLPVADIFIASYSSTVIWSVICGIKTLVMNFYGFNSSIFDELKSIMVIEDKNLFVGTVNNLLESKVDFSSDWKQLSKEEVFDNKVIDRYLEIINDKSELESLNE